MRAFELKLRIISPTIVTKKRTERGFISATDHMPATTVRGAVLSMLYREGRVSRELLKTEAEKPKIIASPSYPLVGSEKSYPSPPFIYKCKVCRATENMVSKILEGLEEGKRLEHFYELELACSKGHLALETFHPRPIVVKDESGKQGFERVTFHSYKAISVGISKHRGTSQRGMLFEYEALAAGQKLWVTLALPEDEGVYSRVEVEKDDILFIGRGTSRGFGKVKVEEVVEIDVEAEAEKVENAVYRGPAGNTVVLHAHSHLLSSAGSMYYSFPEEINLDDIAKRASLKGGGKLVVEAVYGRTSTLIAGWDMAKNRLRPILEGLASPGSIVVARVIGGIRAASRSIAALRLLGTVEDLGAYHVVGVNMLTPIRTHEIFGVEK